MKSIRFFFCLIITVALIYVLDNNWRIAGTPVPALGEFLDPFHGFWQNIERFPFGESELKIKGLEQPVTVVYDSLYIPHIFAENDNDLFLAQGYITAQHRLWQMEFQVLAAAGRISEIIGEAALDYDRRQRRLGMVYGAEHATEAMMQDPVVKNVVLQYTAGVNQYIENLDDDDLPFEYKLLNYKPEPWTPLKMGLLLKNLSQTLNISESDIEMTNALNLFGREMVDLLYFDSDHPTGDPIVSQPGGWNFSPVTLDTVALAVPGALVDIPREEKQQGIGSNNWVVSGSKTSTGAPILCNDPHLNLSFPSIWYVTHLHSPSRNVMGATIPGAPVIIIGFNDSIAWGETNAQRDLVDWYRIQFRDGERNEYLSDGQWRPVQKKVEKIMVRDGDPYYDTVVYTHHGPVVYDNRFHGDDERNGYAFRWIAHDRSNELEALLMLNRANNYDDYMSALDKWSAPAQNFAFASVSGDIAMRIQGKFPVRRRNEGKFVLDGTKTSEEWQAFIPFEQNVMIKNPARGFVSSANQFPADSTYPYYIYGVDYETYRNRRINDVLSKATQISAQDLMKLQSDNYNLQAAESLPLMLSLLDKTALVGKENEVVVALGNWDYFNNPESVPATYYEVWWIVMKAMMWDEMENEQHVLETPNDFPTIRLMETQPDFPMFDIVSTPDKEDLAAVLRLSFREAVKRVQEWETKSGTRPMWGRYKNTYIQHLMRLAPLSQHVNVGGGNGIVNAASSRSGPSWRMIVSLEKSGPVAWGVYPGGQSGNPGSPFYDNMVSTWASGQYFRLNFATSTDDLFPKSVSTTRLIPSE